LFDDWISSLRYNGAESLKESIEGFRNWFNYELEIQQMEYKRPPQIIKGKNYNITKYPLIS
jgi:hypothetical protein